MSENLPHILILGGGFGGLSAANEIRNSFPSSKARITVVDKKNWFMVGFVKLWIMNGTRTFENSTGSLDELREKEIDFINEEILQIDLQTKNVKTTTKNLSYDFLIIAMGATLAPEKIPGLIENGMNLYDHNQLTKIHDELVQMKSGSIAIAIMGMPYKCPPAPFEAALLIDSLLRKSGTRESIQIHVYSPAPITLPAAGPVVSQKIFDLINSENITFHNSCKVKSVEKNTLVFEDGKANFDLLLAIPPHTTHKVIQESGLTKDDFIKIDRDCKTPFDNVYAIGDITSLSVAEKFFVPKAGVFAEGEGLTVAKNIIAKIQSKEDKSLFDGKGACFIESGKDTASLIEVDMFSESKPVTNLTDFTKEHLQEKIEFEKERVTRWF